MALLINNDVARRCLTMAESVEAMEKVLKQYAQGLVAFQPRTDLWAPTAEKGGCNRRGSLPGAMYDLPTLARRFKSGVLTWIEYNGAVIEERCNMDPGRTSGTESTFLKIIQPVSSSLQSAGLSMKQPKKRGSAWPSRSTGFSRISGTSVG